MDVPKAAVPIAYEGYVYGVFKTDSAHPERPMAVFTYRDHAYEWARRNFGKHDTYSFRFHMSSNIEVRMICLNVPRTL